MTRREIAWALGLIAAAGALYAWQRSGRVRPREEALRPPLSLEVGGPGAHVAYAFDLMVSARRETVGTVEVPLWNYFGEEQLVRMGPVALDFLLDEARYETYRDLPNVLANVLRFLPRISGLAQHPRVHAFLQYWLDPTHCPPDVEGSAWADSFRREIFPILVDLASPLYAERCVEMLKAGRVPLDLREHALRLLLRSGEGTRLFDLYADLPPHAAEPDGAHRMVVLNELRAMAAAGAGQERQAMARAMMPLLERLLDAPMDVERVTAISVLARLGVPRMLERLMSEFDDLLEKGRRQDDAEGGRAELSAWTALEFYVQQRPDARAREICLAQMGEPAESPAYVLSIGMLGRSWPEDPAVRNALWTHLERNPLPDLAALQRLLPYDRPGVLGFLRRRLHGSAGHLRSEIVRAIGMLPLPEAAPQILDLIRRSPEGGERYFFYGVLATLNAREVVPLMIQELEHSADPQARRAVSASLLDIGTPEAHAAISHALLRLDAEVVESIWPRATTQGAAGLPDLLLPAMLEALRRLPGESARQKVVLALRGRGLRRGVADALHEAYRRDPSAVVALTIRDALADLYTRSG